MQSNETYEHQNSSNESLQSTERKNQYIRNVPVLDSPYMDVWMRAKSKLRVIFVLRAQAKQIHLYGYMGSMRISEGVLNFESDRKLTSNLFEVKVKESLPFLIIHPSSKPKIIWNFIIALTLIYTVTIMPFSMAFYETNSYDV